MNLRSFAAIAFMALLVACRKDEDKNAASGGSALANMTQLPSDWPSDKLPLYPGATIVSSSTTKSDTQVTTSVQDDAAKIEAFYGERVDKYGATHNRGTGDSRQLLFSIDGSFGMIAIEPGDVPGGVTVRMTIAKLKKR